MPGQERRRNAEIKLRELQQQLQQVMSVLGFLFFSHLFSHLRAQLAQSQTFGPADDLG